MAGSGPRMMFDDCLCAWTGDEMMMHGTLHCERHLTFTANINEFCRKTITLKNVGTSVIYYNWEIIKPNTSFDFKQQRTTVRFFFNKSPSVLVPDDKMTVIISFYSREPGLFHETWQLKTRPVLCGGANVYLRLRGAAVNDSTEAAEIAKTEAYLLHQQNFNMVNSILRQLVKTINSPIVEQISEDKVVFREEANFRNRNPQLGYHRDVIDKLHNIYSNAKPHARPWDLTFETLESAVYESDHVTNREETLEEITILKGMLDHPCLTTLTMGNYHITYILWVQTIDRMVSESISIVFVMESLIKKRKEEVIPIELAVLMRRDKKLRTKYNEILYLLVYSLISEMMDAMEKILEDAWF